ncbi:uncharacterized protein LOC135095690 [Scylla paramamosain]|uniref:uncharacterized protein LOC135095690 n=1 Tax=Scylla paramamosain TaxID=85552 RepID=UPI0030830B7A
MMAACTVGEPHAHAHQLLTSLFPPLTPIASFTAAPLHAHAAHHHHHHHPLQDPHAHPHAHHIHLPLQEAPPPPTPTAVAAAHLPLQMAPTPRPPVHPHPPPHHPHPHPPPLKEPPTPTSTAPPPASSSSSSAGVGKTPSGGGGVGGGGGGSAPTPHHHHHHHETSDMRTLYVGNLDAGASEELLMAVFSHIGPVRSCKLIHEQSEESSGNDPYCFVEFADRQSAEHALHTMNKRLCLGKVRQGRGKGEGWRDGGGRGMLGGAGGREGLEECKLRQVN